MTGLDRFYCSFPCCLVTVIVPWRFLLVLWVDMQGVIGVLADHATYFSVFSSLLISIVHYTPFESPVYKVQKQL